VTQATLKAQCRRCGRRDEQRQLLRRWLVSRAKPARSASANSLRRTLEKAMLAWVLKRGLGADMAQEIERVCCLWCSTGRDNRPVSDARCCSTSGVRSFRVGEQGGMCQARQRACTRLSAGVLCLQHASQPAAAALLEAPQVLTYGSVSTSLRRSVRQRKPETVIQRTPLSRIHPRRVQAPGAAER
jgi:hypothetical protein